MMDVLKQLKLLTTDLCWIQTDDVVMLSVQAKESVESESYEGFSKIASTQVQYLNLLAKKFSLKDAEVQLRLL